MPLNEDYLTPGFKVAENDITFKMSILKNLIAF